MYELVVVKKTHKKWYWVLAVVMLILILIGLYYFNHFLYKEKFNNIAIINVMKVSKEAQIEIEEFRKTTIAQMIMNIQNKRELSEEQYNNIINIYSSSEKKIAYLTFDDGPSSSITPLILDVLKTENIKAVFFVLGVNVDRNPDIVRRAKEEGHYIASHGYSHIYNQIYVNKYTILDDYNKGLQSIQNALNDSTYLARIYRFPGGSNGGKHRRIKAEGKEYLKENNIAYLDWNALTCDAEGIPTKESIMENLKNTIEGKNNVVILMHDAADKVLTYETLPEVISYLREQGYEFGDLYKLLDEY